MQVLVAVSDGGVRAWLADVLQNRGHDVRAFDDGPSALGAWQQATSSLVIVERQLPELDAAGMCREIRASPHGDAPTILVLTDSTRPGDLAAALDAGADDYLAGPLDGGMLDVRLTIAERQVAEIAERKRVEEALRTQALYDSLTGLPNRTLLMDRLQHTIVAAARSNEPLALFVMDLDRFKEVNDTLGHHAGDLLLRQVGTRLHRLLRESDTVARLGGDEFAVLLPGAHQHGAVLAARRIVRALEQPFIVDGIGLEVGASIGIALFPDNGEDANLLVQRADVAMYIAKETGGGHAFYTSDRDEHTPNRLALMGELRGAVEGRQLLLHYQPKVSFQTKVVTGTEALVRWQHPQLGFIPPDRFIPAAERTGLMRLISQFVLDTAVGQSGEWNADGLVVNIAVNLSARNLHDAQLADRVRAALNTWKLAPDRLELEITESAVMVDPVHALDVLTRLRDIGVRIAIDDFGTGYTSLGYLKRLPVSQVKIDRSFVMDMTENENDAAIVRSIINLGHDLGLKVVAEGVEHTAAWDALLALGCDEAQGFLLARPMPASAFPKWLSESRWTVRRAVA